MYISYYNLFLHYMAYHKTVFFAFLVAYLVCTYLSYWHLFQKMGIHPWYSVLPFLNEYKLFEMSWGDGYFCCFEFLPFVGIVFRYIILLKLCQSMNKGSRVFIIFMFLIPVLGRLVLAFGRAVYIGPEGRDMRQNPYKYSG